MRVLFLYPYLPSPRAAHGSARLISALLRDVASEAEVTLVCAYRPGEREWVDEVKPLCRRVVAVERPFASDMGSVRRTTERGKTAVRRATTGFPVSVVKLRRASLRKAIAETIAAESFDVAHVELATLAQYGDLLSGIPSLLIDHEAAGSGEESERWASYVQGTYGTFTRCACLSSEDADHLRQLAPGLDVAVRPAGIAIPDLVSDRRPEPGRVLFFGSAEHAPNRDALDWISSEVMPVLRSLVPDVRLVCAGFRDAELPEVARARSAGVEMLGFVDDLGAEIGRAAVVLAPVRSGRGVRIKNLEALAHGAPLVTTPLGARGLGGIDPSAIAIADDAEGLASQTAAWLAAPEAAMRAGQKGREDVARLFSFDCQAAWTLAAWRDLAANR